MSESQLAQRNLVPPPRSYVAAEYGYACDAAHDIPRPDVEPPEVHVGCPGWWPLLGDPDADGWLCICDCHETWAGWPGHDMLN